MAVHGYITHAAHNKRWTALLVLGYILAFEVIGAFALTMVLLNFDHEHTILTDPAGYAIRYALPIALLAGAMFWKIYSGHAKAVTHALGVQIVTREDEPRFVQIAEEQCTALGVRLPRFGIIEASEPNAVTVGEGPTRGLIAVTRGLLDQLDDDELAAILAHEASHIRHGDTRLLAANHAMMRTAVILQMNNPLRFEDWRQAVIVLLMPPMLLIMLAGSALTTFSMQLSRAARRGLKLSRDHVADGEAIRVTHFPEALLSAIAKIGGRGAFRGSHRVEGLLFDGPADHEGGSHPAIQDRLDAIGTLGRALMDPARRRHDSRGPARPVFGRRPPALPAVYPLDPSGRPLEQPRPPSRFPLLLYFTDRKLYREWHNACIAWAEWQLRQPRNLLGLTRGMVIPVAAACAGMFFIYWPKDGNLSRFAGMLNPAAMVDIAREVNSGPFCSGPSYPDGKCPGAKAAPKPEGQASRTAFIPGPTAVKNADGRQNGSQPMLPSNTVPLLLFVLIVIAIFKPSLLRFLFGHIEPLKRNELRSGTEDKVAESPPLKWNAQGSNGARTGPVTFGRRQS